MTQWALYSYVVYDIYCQWFGSLGNDTRFIVDL